VTIDVMGNYVIQILSLGQKQGIETESFISTSIFQPENTLNRAEQNFNVLILENKGKR
jgi:hypothetical protein